MATFNPYTDFKYSGNTGSSNFSSYFNPGSEGSSGIGTGADTWQKGFNLKGDDPFGLDQSKKKSPWTSDFLPFAGQRLSEFAKGRYGQGVPFGSGDLRAGGGGVSQSGDLTIVYPQQSQVIPAQGGGLGSTIGSIAGAALGTLIAPGIGTTLGGQLGGAAGSFFG